MAGQLRRVPPEPIVGVWGRSRRAFAPIFIEVEPLTNRHPPDFTDAARQVGVAAGSPPNIYDDDVLRSPLETYDDWIGLTDEPLPLSEVGSWVVKAGCGGVVTFVGTVRDNSDGRSGVESLEYEAYSGQVESRLAALAADARSLWPGLGRVALLHRVGLMGVGEASVLVAVSAPHRGQAFEAARWCIDTLKSTVPIWKRETWSGGSDWAGGATEIQEVGFAHDRSGCD
ncbi:MAG: molybdenum cofactor biosynthesis protein MoaE [Acidimicrobiales bacterium]